MERESRGPRSEFVDGTIWAMVGGTIRHAQLVMALGAAFHGALRGKRCQAYSSDLRLLITARNMVTYPDMMVICGQPECHPGGPKDTVLNPTAIFEVLSPSTESFDRGEKLAAYRTIPSARHIVLLSQDAPWAELHTRVDEDSWSSVTLKGPDAQLRLDALELVLPLGGLYVDLPDA